MDIDVMFPDEQEFTPFELAAILKVRVETVYRWLKHPTMFLPFRSEKRGFGKLSYFIKGKDIKEYFKLRNIDIEEELSHVESI